MGTARRLAVAVLTVALTMVLGLAFAPGSAPVAGAQTGPTTTLVPLDDQPIQSPRIIPTPNSTSQPTQYLVMLLILAALVAIVLLVRRESRKNQANQTHKPA